MRAYEDRKPAYFATPAVGLILALRTSLRQIAGLPYLGTLEKSAEAEGPQARSYKAVASAVDARVSAHAEVSNKAKSALRKMGLDLVPVNPEASANTMTAVYLPPGIAQADLVGKLMGKGVVVAGGLLKEWASKYFRCVL